MEPQDLSGAPSVLPLDLGVGGRSRVDLQDSVAERAATRQRRVGYLLALAAGSALLLLRQGGHPLWTSIFAEDGIFAGDALWQGPSAIADVYSGYVSPLPRLLAVIGTSVPVEWASTVISGGAAIITAVVAVFVYSATGPWIRDRWVRFAISTLTVALPVLTPEAIGSAAYLQFVLMWGGFWALIWLPESAAGKAISALVCGAALLAGAAPIALTPLVVVRLIMTRRPADHVVTVIWLAGLAVQLVMASSTGDTSTPDDPLQVLPMYVLRVGAQGLLGLSLGDSLWRLSPVLVFVIASVVLLGIPILAAMRIRVGPRGADNETAIVWLAMTGSFFLFAASALLRWGQLGHPETDRISIAASRLTIAPILLLLTAILVTAAGVVRRRGRSGTVIAAVVLGTIGLGVLLDLRATDNYRASAPDWPASISTARDDCTTSGREATVVAISPPGWSVRLPCTALRR